MFSPAYHRALASKLNAAGCFSLALYHVRVADALAIRERRNAASRRSIAIARAGR